MSEQIIEPVIVCGNAEGGCIEIDIHSSEECCIIVKQGKKYAALVGNIGLLMETNLEAGSTIKNGRIVTKEQLEPYDPDEPEFLLKRKSDGTVCRKDGMPIYSHSYFTYDKWKPSVGWQQVDFDEIIEPDN